MFGIGDRVRTTGDNKSYGVVSEILTINGNIRYKVIFYPKGTIIGGYAHYRDYSLEYDLNPNDILKDLCSK